MKLNHKIFIFLVTSFASVAVISSISIALLQDKMKATGDALSRLRTLMQGTSLNIEPLIAYIIPSDDAHQVSCTSVYVLHKYVNCPLHLQSEYIAPRDRRRHFITGFTGSAGTAVVTAKEALLWTDGRYYQQAALELDENWTLMKDGLPETLTLAQWLQRNCQKGDRIGVDPNLMSTRTWGTLANAIETQGCIMTAVKENLVDLVWDDQPSQPNNPVITLDVKYAGKLVDQKLIEIRAKMQEHQAKVLVVTALDELACKLSKNLVSQSTN